MGGAVWAVPFIAAIPLLGQVRVGEINTNLSGTVSGGYMADYGNTTPSDHSFALGGTADLNGYYYNPKFLSFDIQPYYNQSRANSEFQSIIGASGASATTSIFGGSSFPGSISYARSFSSSGNFGVPGLADYITHGQSDALNIGWSEHLPNFPSISAGYQQGGSDTSIYGASGDVNNHFRGFNANINDTVAGFTLTGGYHRLSSEVDLPQFLTGVAAQTSQSKSDSYSAGIGHQLPFRGSFSAGASRSNFDSTYTGGQYSGTLDTLTSGASFNPVDRVHFGVNAQYLDNLFGSLYQAALTSAAILPGAVIPSQSSHSLDITGYGTYEFPGEHLTFGATVEHRDQRFAGASLSSQAVTGTVTYSDQVRGGTLTATAGFNQTSITPSDQSRLGFLGIVNFTRDFGRWTAAGSVNYSQNVQTLLASYTTDNYGYSGTMSRRFHRRSNWALIASGSKAGLAFSNGSSNFSQTYSTAVNLQHLSASASFSKASGNSILTNSGLVPVSVVQPVLTPSAVILYGGTSYSASLGATPIRGLTLSASYARAYSDTHGDVPDSNNRTEQMNARIQYLIRKIYLQAGYIRLKQGFSGSGTGPVDMNSVYIGLARWFNFL